jgi:chromosome segregation ATPase
MNTPTPRTDAAWSASFDGAQLSAGQTARALRECSQKLETELAALRADLAALTAERDQLRATIAEMPTCRCGLSTDDQCELTAKLGAATTERDHLHAQLRALTLICGTNDANKFETWIDRANARAEKAESNLAVERARLDWLETPSGIDWQWEPERLTVSRASIDAAMTEDAKLA